jgi:probable HAF family extracellular repeat protein
MMGVLQAPHAVLMQAASTFSNGEDMPLTPHGVGRRAIAALLLVTMALAGMALPAQAQVDAAAARTQHIGVGKTTYRVINLSDGPVYGDAAINASGQVAFSWAAEPLRGTAAAYFYDGASVRNIGRLGNDFAVVSGLNDAGQVVGQLVNAQGLERTFVWSTRRGMLEVDVLPDVAYTGRSLINNRGVVTGLMSTPNGNRVFRWSRTDSVIDLGTLQPSDPGPTYASGINDAGTIVGYSRIGGDQSHAFRWSFGSGMVDIHGIDSTDSLAAGIDAAGNIAGNYIDRRDGDVTWRAFVWTPGTGMRPLAYGAGNLQVTRITSGGRVVGSINNPFGNSRAFTWTRPGGVIDLGTLGGTYASAGGANNNGQVVGNAANASGQTRPFVWSARYGMLDLTTRVRHVPPGLVLESATAIADNGSILAQANTGLVLLKPMNGAACTCPHTVGPILGAGMTPLGAALDAAVGIGSDKPGARYKVTWSWGDGATFNGAAGDKAVAATVTPPDARGAGNPTDHGVVRSSARHTYTAPGVYTVSANVVDVGSGASVKVSRRIIVQDAPGRYGRAETRPQ